METGGCKQRQDAFHGSYVHPPLLESLRRTIQFKEWTRRTLSRVTLGRGFGRLRVNFAHYRVQPATTQEIEKALQSTVALGL